MKQQSLFTAPYQPHSDTSLEAALAIAPKLNELENAVHYILLCAGDMGRTDEEGWNEINTCWASRAVIRKTVARTIKESTYRARRRWLVQLWLVKKSGKRRPTASGRSATVWVTTGVTE